MTLICAILKKVQSKDTVHYDHSPPPEIKNENLPQKKKVIDKYKHVKAKVDNSPPLFDPMRLHGYLNRWRRRMRTINDENVDLVIAIKNNHFTRGRVDSRWSRPMMHLKFAYENRINFQRKISYENQTIYNRIISTGPKVASTAELQRDWWRNRRDILYRAQAKFVLFPPIPQDDIEDPAFKPPAGVKRPRVYLTLRIKNAAELGVLEVELFTDVCPLTCGLFLDLLDGDGLGHGYVGTEFFRKVPTLFWRGGDVIYNTGVGCYAQRGRTFPIGAENYHFSHSMPGLLSMRMTPDDEMCGIFNITFKPLPQFDLRNVVFARVVRPSHTFTYMTNLGSPFRKQPVVELTASRRKVNNSWVHGLPNTKVIPISRKKLLTR